MSSLEFLTNRSDYSQFVVHLTRDTHNGPAEENLESIIRSRCIKAVNHHCLLSYNIKDHGDEDLEDRYKICSFTETPLDQIRELVKKISGRKITLEPYGLIFEKKFLIERGGSPAIYINAYSKDAVRREILSQFRRHKDDIDHPIHEHLAVTNVMREGHDFHWEREWRHLGDIEFELKDIVAIIAPSKSEINYVRSVPVINPNWTYEQIVLELSRQHRALYNSYKELKQKIGIKRKVLVLNVSKTSAKQR